MAQTDLKYVIAYSSVSHMGVVMLGAATLTVAGLNGIGVPDVRARHHDRPVLRAGRPRLREGALARDLQDGRLRRDDAGIATAFTIAGLSSLGLPATAGFVAEFLTFLGAWSSDYPWWLFPGVIGAFLTSIYVLRVAQADLLGPEERRPALPEPARRAGDRMGGAGDSGVRAGAVRRRAGSGNQAGRHRDGAAARARRRLLLMASR